MEARGARKNRPASLGLEAYLPVLSLRAWVVAGFIAWRLLLDVAYIFFISPKFSYSGLTCDFDLTRYAISWAVMLLMMPAVAKLLERRSIPDIVVFVLFLISFVPHLTVFSCIEFDWQFCVVVVAYWIALLFFNSHLPRFSNDAKTNVKIKRSQLITLLFLVLTSVIVLFISYRYNGLRISLDFYNVYDQRLEARDNDYGFLAYFYSACRATTPLAIVYLLSKKKKLAALWFVFITLLLFSVDGTKSVVYSAGIAFIAYFMFEKREPSFYLGVLLAALLAALILEQAGSDYSLLSVFFRRVLFLPAYLDYCYYDFFSVNEIDFFRQGILGRIGFPSPYSTSISFIIGDLYYGGALANLGLLADVFTNTGPIGAIIMPAFIVVYLRIIERVLLGLDTRIAAATIMLVVYHLTNSFLTVNLLTHGGIAMCLMLYFIPRGDGVKLTQITKRQKKAYAKTSDRF